jgi:7,8-dihydroneopterin aldolase/epimerase/oxygenase
VDRIILRGMRFHGRHGVYAWEREVGQPFLVDLRLDLPLAAAGQSDRLRDSVDYTAVYAVVRGVVEGPPARLIEHVAERVADAVLAAFAPVVAVEVTVHKPHAALGGPVDSVMVSVARSRGGDA